MCFKKSASSSATTAIATATAASSNDTCGPLCFMWTCLSLSCLLLITAMPLTILFGYQMFYTGSCDRALFPQGYLRRGNTWTAQENSVAAVLAASNGSYYGPQFDVRLTSDDALVCHHDESTGRLTGVSSKVADQTAAQLRTRVVGVTVDGHVYSSATSLAFLDEMLEALCGGSGSSGNETTAAASFMVSVRTDDQGFTLETRSQVAIDALVSTLAASPCTNDRAIIVDTQHFQVAKRAVERIKYHERNFITSLRIRPNTLPLGEHLWLKMRAFHWYSGADILAAHYVLAAAHPDIFNEYRSDGFCTAADGGSYEKIQEAVPANAVDLPIVDLRAVGGDDSAAPEYIAVTYYYTILLVVAFVMLAMYAVTSVLTALAAFKLRGRCCPCFRCCPYCGHWCDPTAANHAYERLTISDAPLTI